MKKDKRVLFYTDVGTMAGMGHYTETANLIKAIRKRDDIKCYLAMPDDSLIKGRAPEGVVLFRIGGLSGLYAHCVLNIYDAICINTSNLNPGSVDMLSALAPTVIITEHDRDCIGTVNFNVSKKPHNMIIGEEYVTGRGLYRVKRKAEDVLISFGASDPFALTNKALLLFQRIRKPFNIHVVVGRMFKYNKELKNIARSYHGRISVNRDIYPAKFSEIMLRSDFGVSAGGDVMYEMAVLGLPFIVWPPTVKQRMNAMNLLKKDSLQAHIFPAFDRNNDPSVMSVLRRALTFNWRSEMNGFLKTVEIGNGINTITDKIIEVVHNV